MLALFLHPSLSILFVATLELQLTSYVDPLLLVLFLYIIIH